MVIQVEDYLYGIASRPTKSKIYNIEVGRVKTERVDLRMDYVKPPEDESIEYLSNLTRLQTH